MDGWMDGWICENIVKHCVALLPHSPDSLTVSQSKEGQFEAADSATGVSSVLIMLVLSFLPSSGVHKAYDGECSPDQHAPCVCQPIYLPVCGLDNQTYPNQCELECR